MRSTIAMPLKQVPEYHSLTKRQQRRIQKSKVWASRMLLISWIWQDGGTRAANLEDATEESEVKHGSKLTFACWYPLRRCFWGICLGVSSVLYGKVSTKNENKSNNVR